MSERQLDGLQGWDAVRALQVEMPADSGADENVDWDRLSADWATPRFPSDYVAFMKTYGSGGISDAFEVIRPVGPDRSDIDGMASETANARALWSAGHAAFPGSGSTGRRVPVIAWGVSVGADVACWLTVEDDPDVWPVVVLGRDTASRWTVFPFGMAEFLRRVFTAEIDSCPFGDNSLWNRSPQKFFHWREEGRLIESGVDPWTGEADPYAGFEFT